jgi:hypothetical protein
MAEAFKELAIQKEITKEEMQEYIVEVLERVFSKDRELAFENPDMLPGKVEASFDIETGDISVKRY